MINFKNPNSLVFLLSALEGLGESKQHLKQSAHELLLAAKVMNKTTSNLVQETGIPQTLPWVNDFIKVGSSLLDELLEKTKTETPAKAESASYSEAPKKIQRGKTKLKVVKNKA